MTDQPHLTREGHLRRALEFLGRAEQPGLAAEGVTAYLTAAVAHALMASAVTPPPRQIGTGRVVAVGFLWLALWAAVCGAYWLALGR